MKFKQFYQALNNSLESKNIFGCSRKLAIKMFFRIKKV